MPRKPSGDVPLKSDPAHLRTWQSRQFFDGRIEIVRGNLSAANLDKFNAMSYVQKCTIISGLIRKGSLI